MQMKTESNKHLILRLTGMNDHDYEVAVFERAFQYLDSTLPDDEEGRKMLSANKHFWSWWTHQWERRNRIVLHRFNFSDPLMVPSELVRRAATLAFDKVHEVSNLNILINRHVMRSTFQMVRTLTGTNLQSHLTHAKEETARS